jgi:hypothetical protein
LLEFGEFPQFDCFESSTLCPIVIAKSNTPLITICDEVAYGLRMPSIHHNQTVPFFVHSSSFGVFVRWFCRCWAKIVLGRDNVLTTFSTFWQLFDNSILRTILSILPSFWGLVLRVCPMVLLMLFFKPAVSGQIVLTQFIS